MSDKLKSHNLVRIPIGDWSDDGHGKCDYFDLEIPVEFTQEMLSANYLNNKELFGFGLKDFVSDYEDGILPVELYETLQGFGFQFSEAGDVEVDVDTDEEEDEIYLGSRKMLDMVIFFIGHGLEGFSAELKEPDFFMFGKWQGPETMIGYGLFF